MRRAKGWELISIWRAVLPGQSARLLSRPGGLMGGLRWEGERAAMMEAAGRAGEEGRRGKRGVREA
jgi:hypothetical protein